MLRLYFILIFITSTTGCSDDGSSIYLESGTKIQKEAHKEVYDFLHKEFPSLENKIIKLIKESKNADDNIEQLKILRREHPTHADLIEKNMKKWKNLRSTTNKAIREIYDKSEEIFVITVINEQKSGRKFDEIHRSLLEKADQALEESIVIKNTIIEGTSL